MVVALIASRYSIIRVGVRRLCQIDLGVSRFREVATCKELLTELGNTEFTHLVFDLSLSDGEISNVLSNVVENYHDLLIATLIVQDTLIVGHVLVKTYNVNHIILFSWREEDISYMLGKFFRNERLPALYFQNFKATTPFSVLASREMELLMLWLVGKGTKEFANLLGVTISTISTVKATIYKKTNTENFVELHKLVTYHYLI